MKPQRFLNLAQDQVKMRFKYYEHLEKLYETINTPRRRKRQHRRKGYGGRLTGLPPIQPLTITIASEITRG
jgi:hypothetical protein